MRQPKISVIIPTYNRIKLLKEAVDSVLKQTFSDYELIISDNCSDDGTKQWASDLRKKNKKVRYYRNKKNLGMTGNWNEGLKHARGEFISILMDDDLWHPDFLKETENILNQRINVGLTCVNIVPFYSKEIKKENKYPKDFYRLYEKDKEIAGIQCIEQYLTSNWLVGLPSGILVRKRCFDELGKFDEIGLDPEMWLRICSKYDFYYLDKPLCYWKVHNSERFTSKLRFIDSIRTKIDTLNKIFSYPTCKNNISILSLKKQAYQKRRKEFITGWIAGGKPVSIKEVINIYKLYLTIPMLFCDVILFTTEILLTRVTNFLRKVKTLLLPTGQNLD